MINIYIKSKSIRTGILSLIMFFTCVWQSSILYANLQCVNIFSQNDTQLYWSYYFPQNLPELTYFDNSGLVPPNVVFNGGLHPLSPMVAYRKSTFFADSKKDPQFTIDQLSTTSKTFQETNKILEYLYNLYRSRNTVSENSIAEMRHLDNQLDPSHTNYVVFFEPTTHNPKVVVRIYDGSARNDLNRNIERIPVKIPIELEYPHLILPERSQGQDQIIELGRMGKEENVQGDLKVLLRCISEYLFQSFNFGMRDKGQNPVIYVEALAPAARLYKNKYHFEVVFGPEDLKIPSNQPARYILRITAKDFIKHNKSFEHFFTVP